MTKLPSIDDYVSTIRNKELIASEIKKHATPLRKAGSSNNIIYTFEGTHSEPLMLEVGFLREEAFKQAGAGVGGLDINTYDLHTTNPYTQLIVWNPDTQEILGGYRYIHCFEGISRKDSLETIAQFATENLASANLFNFQNEFIKEYIPSMTELGRSFVVPDYQASGSGLRSMKVLSELWEGLGGLVATNKELDHFFGKVTMYPNQTYPGVRSMLLYFLNDNFYSNEGLVTPKNALDIGAFPPNIDAVFKGETFKQKLSDLKIKIKTYCERVKEDFDYQSHGVPPLVGAYTQLTDQAKIFGSAINEHFGNVEEIGLLISVKDIKEMAQKKYIDSYEEHKLR